MSSQYVQCLVPSLAGGDVVTDESSLSSTAEAEEEEEETVAAPFPSLVAVHDDHLSASPGTDFNNFDLLRLMAGDTAGVALTRSEINSRNTALQHSVYSEIGPKYVKCQRRIVNRELAAAFRVLSLEFLAVRASANQGEEDQAGRGGVGGQVAPVRGPRGNLRGDDSGFRVLRRGRRRRGPRRPRRGRRRRRHRPLRRLRAVVRAAAHDCQRLRVIVRMEGGHQMAPELQAIRFRFYSLAQYEVMFTTRRVFSVNSNSSSDLCRPP